MNPKIPIICIYHSPCNDGFTAAWAVTHYYRQLGKEVELYPASYSDNLNPPIEECRDKLVYIVDFSYPATQLQMIGDVAKRVILIDHHKTALSLKTQAFSENIELHINMNYSGAMLTWHHFYGPSAVPKLVEYVQDRDMWWKKLEHCDDIHYTLSSYEPTIERWDQLAGDIEVFGDRLKLEADGMAIRRWIEKWMTSYISDHVREEIIAGYIVPIINAPGIFASDIGNILAADAPFSVVYSDDSRGTKFSLRSSKDYDTWVDVSEIAKKYGGGGHPNAAGYYISAVSAHSETR